MRPDPFVGRAWYPNAPEPSAAPHGGTPMGGMQHGGMPHGGMPMEGGAPRAAPADPDPAFIEMMIPHHRDAVAMSREIAIMEEWKQSWQAGSR